MCEAGNFSIHVALSDLRRDGKNYNIIFRFSPAIQYFHSYAASWNDWFWRVSVTQVVQKETQVVQKCWYKQHVGEQAKVISLTLFEEEHKISVQTKAPCAWAKHLNSYQLWLLKSSSVTNREHL